MIYSCCFDKHEIVNLLLKDQRTNVKDAYNASILQIAYYYKYFNTITILIKDGHFDVHHQDKVLIQFYIILVILFY